MDVAMLHVPFSPPSITDVEIDHVVRALRSGWLTTGPTTHEFEKRFAEAVQAPSALAVNSCTSALAIALRLHDVGPGDEVITSTLTFVSTANVIEHTGASLVLVDVLPDTLNIDPDAVAAAITEKTKAVIPVHFAGLPADLTRLRPLCEAHNVAIIEDAAHAFPAAHSGRPIGSSSNLTAFSFYATKNLATGEGGMLTGDPEMIDRARSTSLHGMSRGAWNRYSAKGNWQYDVIEAGLKCNMGDLQAALGLAQLSRLKTLQARRKQLYERYDQAFAGCSCFQTPACSNDPGHAHHLYVLRLNDPLTIRPGRDQLITQLRESGISPSVHFIPVHLHTYYREKYGYLPEDFPVAYFNYLRMLSLPLSPAHTGEQIDAVIENVLAATSETRQAA